MATAESAFFRPSPPRGMIRSTRPSCAAELGQLLAAAAGDERERAGGQPGRLGGLARDAASTALECAADEEPRSTIALPDFRHSAAASIVTFGRAS